MTRRQYPWRGDLPARLPDDGLCERCGSPATNTIEVLLGDGVGKGYRIDYRACARCRRRALDNLRGFITRCQQRAIGGADAGPVR